GALAQAQGGGGFVIGAVGLLAGEEALELLEQRAFFGAGVVVAQAAEHLFQQRQGPAALEEFFRRQVVGRLQAVTLLGVRQVDGDDLAVAAAFLGVLPVALVGKEVLAGGQQERAEFPLGRVDGVEEILLQEAGEVFLGQVLGLFGAVALPANEGVERIPVGAA